MRSMPTNAMGNDFGPVAAISSAPVSIGNSIKGVKAVVKQAGRDRVRIVGRDYAFTAYNSGTATGWLLVGGFPLTPAAFVSSVLQSYTRIYSRFRFNKICVHYITSSSTSTNGDVMFQYNPNRDDPVPNWTSTAFLPYALSEPTSILGPQWTNHSVLIQPNTGIRDIDLGVNGDIDAQTQGELLFFSKTSSTDSPGYVMIDYDLELFELGINPRAGQIPNANCIWQAAQVQFQTNALTANTTTITVNPVGVTGSGGTAITGLWNQTATHQGDVYKVALDVTNTNMGNFTVSAGAVPTAATLFATLQQTIATALSLTDGYTLYMVVEATNNAQFYGSIDDARTCSNPIVAGFTGTPAAYSDNTHAPNAGVWLMMFVSFVGSIRAQNLQQS